MDVSLLLGRAEGQKMEGTAAAVDARRSLGRRFGRACQWALGENIFFAVQSILGSPLLLNKQQVGLRRAMLWYSAAGAVAAVVAEVLAGRGGRRRTAACRAAACAALASAAFSHCVVCGVFVVHFFLTLQGQGGPLLGFLVAAAALIVVVYFAVRDVLGFLAILRFGDDGVADGGKEEV